MNSGNLVGERFHSSQHSTTTNDWIAPVYFITQYLQHKNFTLKRNVFKGTRLFNQLTWIASIQFEPHGDVTVPCDWMNSNEASNDWLLQGINYFMRIVFVSDIFLEMQNFIYCHLTGTDNNSQQISIYYTRLKSERSVCFFLGQDFVRETSTSLVFLP